MKTMACKYGAKLGRLGRFGRDDGGATAIEYALIAAGISIVIVTVVNGIGAEVLAMFTAVEASF